jgi:hydroxyacylglutathione hydrolase
VCRKFGIPLACHEADVAAMDGSGPMLPKTLIVNRLGRLIAGQPCKVSRRLRDGDTIGSFRVIHAPGHTPGHVIYFRESDRLAIAGDLLANMSFITFEPGLRLPPPFFCTDAAQNRRSVELLASLRPSLICFGHGPPLHKVEQLHWFVERMKKRYPG